MTTVYTTRTPVINTKNYTFPYTFKRDAYIDACYCILTLNKAAKDASTDMRFYIYRLKHRWIAKLYREGYCVHASMGERLVWHFIFLIDGVKFQWHLPSQVISWDVKENRSAVFYDWIQDLPRRTRPLEEAIALLEWCCL